MGDGVGKTGAASTAGANSVKTIWLVRHGQSKAQSEGVPWLNPALSERGEEQARALRAVFEERTFDEVISSPLQRAAMTCELSGVRGRRMRFDSRLCECASATDYVKIQPIQTPAWGEPDEAAMWSEGAFERAGSLIAWIARQGAQTAGQAGAHMGAQTGAKTFCLFAHWCILNSFLWEFLGVSDRKLPFPGCGYSAPMDNAGVSVLQMGHPEYGNCIRVWNSTAHLGELGGGWLRV